MATLCIRSELRAGSNLNGRELRDRITALWNKDICEFASIGASTQKHVQQASGGFPQMHSRLLCNAKGENGTLPISLSEAPFVKRCWVGSKPDFVIGCVDLIHLWSVTLLLWHGDVVFFLGSCSVVS